MQCGWSRHHQARNRQSGEDLTGHVKAFYDLILTEDKVFLQVRWGVREVEVGRVSPHYLIGSHVY